MCMCVALSGLPLFKDSSLAAPSQVSSIWLCGREIPQLFQSHPPPLYDVTITHHYNKRRRGSLGRIPADVTVCHI